MKKIAICIALVGLLGLGGQAIAEIGTVDNVPAATLLLPYFSVDLDDPNGFTTLFSINNASAAPAIAHVTLWTDWSVPTLDFNVYLTGYDVYTVNLRDLFVDGSVPQSSHNNTGVSPIGAFSLTSNPVSGVGPGSVSCDDQLPLPTVPPALLSHIQASHTGQFSPILGGCGGADFGDRLARGYITIDNVNFCTLDFPGDQGYFIDGGQGAANNINQLWGDVFWVDTGNNFAQGEALVHVEASSTDPRTQVGEYTFYARFSGGTDNREGLSTTWATRFLNGGAFDGGTSLVVWRDDKLIASPVACGTLPSPLPLSQTQIVIFDEEENPDIVPGSPFSPPIPGTSIDPFPYCTNLSEVGGTNFPVAFDFGWLYLNLNTTTGNSILDPFMQNYVATVMSALGRFSVGFEAIHLDQVANPTDIVLPICDGDPDPADCN